MADDDKLATRENQSTDIEYSPQRLQQLTRIAADSSEEELKKYATEIPSLAVEVTRLRTELATAKGKIAAQLRQLTDKQAVIDALRPGEEAQVRLEELRNQIADVAARADKAIRDRDDTERKLEAAETRIKALIASMTELARASGGEALVNEKERADKLEREVSELRDRIARMERPQG